MFFSAAFLSGAVTPSVVTFLLGFMSWRMIFVVFGLVGLAWAVAWHRWFRSEPADHPAVNAAELEYISAGCDRPVHHPAGARFWRPLLLNRNVAALCLMYFPNSFAFYFCITWLPTYLREHHNFNSTSLDFFSGLPLLVSVAGILLGGVVMDRMTAHFGLRIGRCGVGAAGYLVAAIALLSVPRLGDPVLAALLVSGAVGACMFTLPAAWGSCIDIGGNNSGVVSAAMNTASQIGSLLCPLIVAYTLKWFGDWNISIYLMGLMFLGGTICWSVIDPRKRVLAYPGTR